MHPCVCVTWNLVPWLHHVWELQSWGPNLCPNQGQHEPPACATCLPAPGSTPGTSSHQTLNLRSVSTGFMNIPPCIPATQKGGVNLSPTSLVHTRRYKPVGCSLQSSYAEYDCVHGSSSVSVWYQGHASLGDDHSDNWLWAPSQFCYFGDIPKPLSFPTSPRGWSMAMVSTVISSNSFLCDNWPFQSPTVTPRAQLLWPHGSLFSSDHSSFQLLIFLESLPKYQCHWTL